MLCWMWPGLKPALDWSQHGARPVSPARPGHPLSLLSAGGTDSTLHPVYMSLWHTLCCSGLKCRPVWAQNNTGDTLHCVHIPSVPVCWGVVWDQLIQQPDPVTTSVGLCVVTMLPMLTERVSHVTDTPDHDCDALWIMFPCPAPSRAAHHQRNPCPTEFKKKVSK